MKDISTMTQQKDVRHIVEQLNGVVVKGFNTDIADLTNRIVTLESVTVDSIINKCTIAEVTGDYDLTYSDLGEVTVDG